MIAIGLYASSRTENLDDFMLGGRTPRPGVAALSAGASDMSGRLPRIVSGLIILVFFTFHVSSGMVTGELFFRSSFGSGYHAGLLLVVGVTIACTLLGGFPGATCTDVAQGVLMLIVLIMVPVLGPGAG